MPRTAIESSSAVFHKERGPQSEKLNDSYGRDLASQRPSTPCDRPISKLSFSNTCEEYDCV